MPAAAAAANAITAQATRSTSGGRGQPSCVSLAPACGSDSAPATSCPADGGAPGSVAVQRDAPLAAVRETGVSWPTTGGAGTADAWDSDILAPTTSGAGTAVGNIGAIAGSGGRTKGDATIGRQGSVMRMLVGRGVGRSVDKGGTDGVFVGAFVGAGTLAHAEAPSAW